MPTLRSIVKKGARFMDKYRPGWARRVKITKLDMASSCNCILGQEFGGFGAALWGTNRIPELMGQTDELGFSAEKIDDYSLLTDAWKDEIRARRGSK